MHGCVPHLRPILHRMACGVAIGAALICPSCAPPIFLAGPTIQAVSAGAGAFVNGEIQAAWTVPIDNLWPAGEATLRELEFEVVSIRRRNQKFGLMFAKDLSGRSIEISMKSITPEVTRFTIRVGTFGDEPVSRLIVRQLEIELGKRTPNPALPALDQPGTVGGNPS